MKKKQTTTTPLSAPTHTGMTTRRLLVVIATYRSGSTTVMQMLDKLPGTCVAGENAGMAGVLFAQYARTNTTRFHARDGPWKHGHVSEGAILRAQRAYVTAQLACPAAASTIGFKTIRMRNVREATHLVRLFPDTVFVLVNCVPRVSAKRGTLTPHKCSQHNKLLDAVKAAGLNVAGTLSLNNFTTENFNIVSARLLGGDACHYECVLHANNCKTGNCYDTGRQEIPCLRCAYKRWGPGGGRPSGIPHPDWLPKLPPDR